jgi:hypothetical protein
LGVEGVGSGVVGLGGGGVMAFAFQLHEAIVDFGNEWPIVKAKFAFASSFQLLTEHLLPL